MNLGSGWTATFLDGPRRVMCQQVGVNQRSHQRRICYQFVDRMRPLKRIDVKTGTTLTDRVNQLPPSCFETLNQAARERWTIEGSGIPKGGEHDRSL